jgi:hypothetical protein
MEHLKDAPLSITTLWIDCQCAEIRYVECLILFVVMLTVIMLSAIKPSVVMLSVVVPCN